MTIDCGDNSCNFAKDKSGMRTNGGCRCLLNAGFHKSTIASAYAMFPELLELRAERKDILSFLKELVAVDLGDGDYFRGIVRQFISRIENRLVDNKDKL